MSSSYEDNVSKFVTKHLCLIEEERTEECEQSTNLINTSQGGVFLRHMSIFSYSSCLGGFVIVEFRSVKNNVLKSHTLSYGDVIGVIEGTNLQNKPLATGVVKYNKKESIGVSFDDINSFNEDDGSEYSLVKLANDITYSRLKCSLKALSGVSKLSHKVLVELLFDDNGHLERIPIPPQLLDTQGNLRFINDDLNMDQKEAVKFSLEMKNLAVIHGPPGTGKTTTLVEVILQMVKERNKMLVCAPSNIAVDNLVEKLATRNVKMARLGHPARVMESIARYTLDAIVDTSSSTEIVKDVRKDLNEVLKKVRNRHRKECFSDLHKELKTLRKELQERESRVLNEVLRGSDVVLSTLVTASNDGPLKHLPQDYFHCVVIDECSQALEAACWIVLPRAPKAVLAGDHLQLPPTILSQKAEQGGLGLSLMERTIEKFGKEGYRLLRQQFRMNTDIMTWPSQEMYEGQLEADPSVAGHLLRDLPHVEDTEETGTALLLVDTAGCQLEEEVFETSRCNRGEAGIIAFLVKRLISANVPQTSIAVITPYNYQVEMVKAHLSDFNSVEVRTVDGFQGREKEAVLLSMVRSNPRRDLGFICDRRRLNVAVSRARRFLCVVADSSTVSYDRTLASLLDYIGHNGVVHSAEQYLTYLEMPKEVLMNKKFQSPKKPQCDKKPEKQKKKNVRTQQKQGLNVHGKEEKTKEQEEVEVNHWKNVLQQFIDNTEELEMEFPKSTSAYDRRLIHQSASELNLQHVSVGEGNERYIVVRKTSYKSENNTEPSNDKQRVKKDNNNMRGKQETKTEELGEVEGSRWKNILQKFVNNAEELEMEFPKSVSANDRRLIHEAASELRLQRISVGEGSDRHIVVRKMSYSRPSENITESSSNNLAVKNSEPVSNTGTISLSEELASLHIKNKEQSVRKPVLSQFKKVTEVDDVNNSKIIECKKSQKVSKKSRKKQQPEDFDSVIAEFQEIDKRCPWSGCKIATDLVGLTCVHCKLRFCLSHGLPEVHGCGEAARKAARQDFRHPPPPKPDPRKRSAISRKLEKKLVQMAEERKPRKKET